MHGNVPKGVQGNLHQFGDVPRLPSSSSQGKGKSAKGGMIDFLAVWFTHVFILDNPWCQWTNWSRWILLVGYDIGSMIFLEFIAFLKENIEICVGSGWSFGEFNESK